MTFNLRIAVPGGDTLIQVEAGSSLIFVGANGGGKTRLAVKLEDTVGAAAHRISAHRSLALDPSVSKISEEKSLAGLRNGHSTVDFSERHSHRWGRNAAVKLLNDFDFLLQALFAEQGNVTKAVYDKIRTGENGPIILTKMARLQDIWSALMPHRTLHITADDIQISLVGDVQKYSASQMSDGERAVFYVIGQALLAAPNSMLILDEPELHVHRSIMSKLWDSLEAARPDCSFVYITHDLEFAAARTAQKYVVHCYTHPDQWDIEAIPEQTGFDEALATLILGSRRPILFVESTESGLDVALYRSCYPSHTVIPRGSCEEVKHSVVSLRHNASFTRITCSGIVDADGLHQYEIEALSTLGIAVLPVSEIENLFLLPSVSQAIAQTEGFSGTELDARLAELKDRIFQSLANSAAIEAVVLRYCRRRIDRLLKKIDLSQADSVPALAMAYTQTTSALNIEALAQEIRSLINAAIETRNLPALLAVYDNKGLLNHAAGSLKNQKLNDFKNWLVRALRSDTQPELRKALRAVLPVIDVHGS